MQELGKFNLKINVIPNGREKHMSFSINNKLRFIDSFQFLSSSLDSLVKNLSNDDFKYMTQEFDNNILVKRKGFYRYEYMSDFEKSKEKFSSKEKFYSALRGKKNSDKEYDHVLKVWNKFEMKMMKDYNDLYLRCDVLLLGNVFEKVRNNSLKNSRLSPSHYLSAPARSWDAMLNMKKVELELSPDPDMYIFFDKGMRGWVSYISNRYSKASNKHLKFNDPKQESKHIIYLDVNNYAI